MEAAKTLTRLGHEKVAIGTVEALGLYEEASKCLFPNSVEVADGCIGQLRFNSVKAKERDHAFARACFKACMKAYDFQYAQKVCYAVQSR